MNELTIVMPYIGGCLSVNAYQVRIGTRLTTKIKPEVKRWMGQLEEKSRGFKHNGRMRVYVAGKFTDARVPDIHNLSKVILDAIKKGVELDDKDIDFTSNGYVTGVVKPVLVITLESGNE